MDFKSLTSWQTLEPASFGPHNRLGLKSVGQQ
jgi:hypothetical protein